MYASGLASPVTLAPKSARPIGPNEFPEEFMTAFTNPVDRSVVDLTLAENDNHQIRTNADPTAGDSSDKPIELDLDMDMNMSMNELFGDNPETSSSSKFPSGVENMFSMSDNGAGPSSKATKNTEFIDLTEHDILATLSSNSMTTPNLKNSDPMTSMEAPSPATLLATSFPQHLNPSNTLENSSGLPDQQFDMVGLAGLGDLGAFNSTPDFSIDAFLNIGANTSGGSGGNDSNEKVAASTERQSIM